VLTKEQLRSIAETKLPDLNAHDVDAAMKVIQGTARSMGVRIAGVADTGVYLRSKKKGVKGAQAIDEEPLVEAELSMEDAPSSTEDATSAEDLSSAEEAVEEALAV
jgi:hypothetical protein